VNPVIFTIGHSTRSTDEFAGLLVAHGIRQVADVRTVPRSRRHPHFGGDALANFLAERGITYRHFPALGGLRRPRPDSINTAWQHPGFRGYADHMQTVEFRQGLTALSQFASSCPTTVLCAEAVWWQCHRRLLADALIVRGIPVLHILSKAEPKPHELSEFAREEGGGVIYPGLL
jgi:uncharacterized protein (DUF488 family)